MSEGEIVGRTYRKKTTQRLINASFTTLRSRQGAFICKIVKTIIAQWNGVMKFSDVECTHVF